jgi:hypothetical protein
MRAVRTHDAHLAGEGKVGMTSTLTGGAIHCRRCSLIAHWGECGPSTPDTRRMVETGTGSMRSTGSGLPEGSSK